MCASYEYTGPENCSPVKDVGDGYVEVASRAANYNPVFYFVVGTAGKPFAGNTSLYVMRFAAGFLCALFIALAGWVTTLWARTRWPIATLLIAMTPVMLFSVSIVAPNGLEMAAGLCLWMSLLGLGTPTGRARHSQTLLLTASASAVVVATLRSLGPLWVALIVVTVATLLGLRAIGGVLRDNRLVSALGVFAVSLAAVASVAWTRTAGTQTLMPSAVGRSDVPTSTAEQIPLWFLQGIAAFPRRSNPAPAIVYALVGLILLGLLVLGLRAASWRLRLTTVGVLVAAVVGPAVFTAHTIRYAGPIWQGRYGMPFHLGVTLLSGLALELSLRRPSWSRTRIATVLGGTMLAIANVVAIVHVMLNEQRTSPLRDSSAWVSAPAWVVSLLVVAGWGAWLIVALPQRTNDERALRG